MITKSVHLRIFRLVAALLGLGLLHAGCASWRRPAPPPRFGLVADVQYADKDTQGARHYRTSRDRLRQCVDDLRRRDLAFVVQLGDLVDGQKEPARTVADLDAMLGVLGRVGVPVFHVVGNHCLTAGKDTLRERLGLARFYYDVTLPDAPGWRFVVLDGNDAGYGVIGEEQLAWFTRTLGAAVEAHERVLCFCHFALLEGAAAHHRMAKPQPVLDAMDAAGNVVAWIAGHDHAGGYAMRKGTHHITLCGMVEAPGENAYAVMELGPDSLREAGVGREPSRDMPIRVPKP